MSNQGNNQPNQPGTNAPLFGENKGAIGSNFFGGNKTDKPGFLGLQQGQSTGGFFGPSSNANQQNTETSQQNTTSNPPTTTNNTGPLNPFGGGSTNIFPKANFANTANPSPSNVPVLSKGLTFGNESESSTNKPTGLFPQGNTTGAPKLFQPTNNPNSNDPPQSNDQSKPPQNPFGSLNTNPKPENTFVFGTGGQKPSTNPTNSPKNPTEGNPQNPAPTSQPFGNFKLGETSKPNISESSQPQGPTNIFGGTFGKSDSQPVKTPFTAPAQQTTENTQAPKAPAEENKSSFNFATTTTPGQSSPFGNQFKPSGGTFETKKPEDNKPMFGMPSATAQPTPDQLFKAPTGNLFEPKKPAETDGKLAPTAETNLQGPTPSPGDNTNLLERNQEKSNVISPQ